MFPTASRRQQVITFDTLLYLAWYWVTITIFTLPAGLVICSLVNRRRRGPRKMLPQAVTYFEPTQSVWIPFTLLEDYYNWRIVCIHLMVPACRRYHHCNGAFSWSHFVSTLDYLHKPELTIATFIFSIVLLPYIKFIKWIVKDLEYGASQPPGQNLIKNEFIFSIFTNCNAIKVCRIITSNFLVSFFSKNYTQNIIREC